MRLKEFEDRKQINELVPALIGGAALAGAGWQAYETYKDIEAYRNGEIDGAELGRRIGTDAAFMVAGGIAGKALQKGWQFSKGGYDLIKRAMQGKDAAKSADDAVDAATKVKPGDTIATPKGDRVAGVDGKPTTIKPGDKAGTAKIKQAAKDANKAKPAGKAGAGAGGAAKVKKPSAGTTGAAIAGGVRQGVKKADDLVKRNPGKVGMGLGALANQGLTALGKNALDNVGKGNSAGSVDKIVTKSKTKLSSKDIVDVGPKGPKL